MDLEWWKSFFEVGGVILLFLTFAFGSGFMLTSKKVNERQAERLRRFDSDLTGAKTELAAQQERTAKAEQELLELSKFQADRYIERGALSSLLKGKASGRIGIWYEPNDPEAFVFAQSLFGELSEGGWKVLGIIPIPETASLSDALPEQYRDPRIGAFDRMLPISVRATGSTSGLALLARSIDPKDHPPGSPFDVLLTALKLFSPKWGERTTPSLPEDEFILVVCPKPMMGLPSKP